MRSYHKRQPRQPPFDLDQSRGPIACQDDQWHLIRQSSIIEAIGAAKSVGRDRWEYLKKLFLYPKNSELAERLIESADFRAKPAEERFNYLLEQLRTSRRPAQKPSHHEQKGVWAPADRAVKANYRTTGKSFSLSLSSRDAGEFGKYISSNLEPLYRAFRETKAHPEKGE